MAVPTAEALSIAHPKTVAVPETVDPWVGPSIQTVGGGACTFTVTLEELLSGVVSLSAAVTVMVCVPGVKEEVFSEKEKPTLGQPGLLGYTAHTSGRLDP